MIGVGYTALYRKFRPMTFGEMVGQEHITKTLKNQIMANRVGHAYLFNGGRGTGKTSSAKILARAINCLNPKDGEPCNECEICKAAINGSLTDIVEMDAASNNGVEDVRSIREEVNFLPTKAKYRVYIIDEVHMLSIAAFNALLKTLEEPPEHVKFILATTEPQKLPATILSRCQRFDFKRISNDNIIKRLKIVCEESNIEITEGALQIIAVLSEGAMRDALSILERCIQDGENKIDENKIKDLVGIPKITYVHNIMESLFKYDVENTLKNVDIVLDEGKDINNLLWEMIKYTKEDIKIAVEQFYTYFLQPQTLNFEAFNAPVKNALHRKIREYYEEFKYLGLSDEKIRDILEENMGNTEKMNKIRDICMVKYSPDVTMRLYRQLLLQNFEIGMRISGEEIEQKINSLRREVGLPDQKHNTALEYFNLLFETKRIKFSDTRKMGYEIISAF